jgi:hypothetical protein
MKRKFKISLLILLLLNLIYISSKDTQACIQNSKLKEIIKVSITKEKIPPIISFKNYKYYTQSSLIDSANIIMKATILDKKEMKFTVYRNNKVSELYYKDLITIKINKILKQDNGNKLIDNNSIINIYNDSCSHNLIEGSIKLEKGKQYILFLERINNSSDINYLKYAKYSIIAPEWSDVYVNNNIYTFNKNFDLLLGNIISIIRINGSIDYTSYDFEERLSEQIRYQNKVVNNLFNKPINFLNLNANQIQSIKVYSFLGINKTLTKSSTKKDIVFLLKNLSFLGTALYSTNGPTYTLIINYIDSNKIKTENILFSSSLIEYSAFDKYNNLLNKGYYKIKNSNVYESLKVIIQQ